MTLINSLKMVAHAVLLTCALVIATAFDWLLWFLTKVFRAV